MNRVLKKVKANIAIIFLWLSGVLFAYLFFVCAHRIVVYEEVSYYLVLLNVFCLVLFLFSACVFYFLFNYTYEKNQLEKNILASKYISLALKKLNERFVLIDVRKETYEFVYAMQDNKQVYRSGPYSAFIEYLLGDVKNDTDKEKLAKILPLESLLQRLIADERNSYSIPVELNVEGQNRWDMLSFIVVEQDKNGISKVLLSRRDTTETQKKVVRQQELLSNALLEAESANKAKSTFLFNMSHDIRTPMNAIIGFTSMAKKYLSAPEKAEGYLDKVDISSKHLLNIINDILDMARIDSGKVELEAVPIDIIDETHAMDALFRSSMEEKEIEFTTQVDIEDNIVLCDGIRINQILINLIGNALKYTKPGGKVFVHYIQTGRTADGFANFEFHVKDTGIGMCKEFQQYLFDAFERERNSTVSGIEGTGLGLAIAKRLTDLMGGNLECISELGVGTEFILTLSLQIGGNPISAEDVELDISDFKGKRVLLVEDNDLNREIAREMLEELGFVIFEACDGSEAVEKVASSKPGDYQLVLMDIQMPYMNGYRATSNIRNLEDERLANIPIVAMTANAFDEDRQKALDAGMNAHLSKPIDINQIVETLQGII